MSSPLDPLLEALARYWWGRILIALLLFGMASLMTFAMPNAGRFDPCRLAVALAFAAIGLFFLVTGIRTRLARERDDPSGRM